MIELLIGFLIGLVVGPVIRSWMAWREYADASREARLHEEMLRKMSARAVRPNGGPASRTTSGAGVG